MSKYEIQTPIKNHPALPDEVPLIASFHDDRNRLSYYNPILEQIEGVNTPVTKFFPVEGNKQTFFNLEYRHITQFMQDLSTTKAFVRSDYSSGKFDGEKGSLINSQDPWDIETTILEMFRQLSRSKRRIGGRVAVREWIPHEIEVRYFIQDGNILYADTLDDDSVSFPDNMAEKVADEFNHFSWSVDFILNEKTNKWYLIDMGLNGLYPSGSDWVAMSEHIDKSKSPQQYTDEMPEPKRFQYIR